MVLIPARTALAAMQRPDIQKLCKDNNIKANMRTEEMIDALCVLATGKDVSSRTHRSTSLRTASQTSRPPSRTSAVKARESSVSKKALQVSESRTEAETTPDANAAVVPTTRRKAKEIQTRLGKGRPVIAGGSGARAITKRKSRTATVTRRPDPIPEEDEENGSATAAPVPVETTDVPIPAAARSRPTSPTQLPTPTPSHPSQSHSTAHQIALLEARITQLENNGAGSGADSSLKARLRDLEASNITMSSRLEAATQQTSRLEADIVQHVRRLDAELGRVLNENGALKERLNKFEAMLHAQGKQGGVMDIDLAGSAMDRPGVAHQVLKGYESARRDADKDSALNVERNQPVRSTTEVVRRATPPAAAPQIKRIGSLVIHNPEHENLRPASPAAPSPALPTLGKRNRNDETPETGTEKDDGTGSRITRPMRKRLRVDSGGGRKDDLSVPLPTDAAAGPSSTSTPHARRSDSPSAFFTAGRRSPTPFAKRRDEEVDVDIDAYINLDAHDAEEEQGASSSHKSPPATGTNLHAGLFSSPPPVFFSSIPGNTLPYPLHPLPAPHTPPPPSSPEQEEFTTPAALGAAWRNPQTPPPPTPTHGPLSIPQSPSPLPHSQNHTFRSGRRERNDRYNPYFTPGPGASRRTGLTPPPASGLGSPAKVESEAAGEDDKRLRTLYGTELEGDTRFGDFGRGLRFDWARYGR